MQITQAVDYALRSLIFLAEKYVPEQVGYSVGVVNAQDIAEAQKIPLRFLLKIMRKLSKEGLVNSFRGNNGGYQLAMAPTEITLLQVVESIDGKISINRCLEDHGVCNRNAQEYCKVHSVLNQVQTNLINQLAAYSLADLIN